MATQQIGVAGLTKEARLWYETVLQGRNVPDFLHENFGWKVSIPANGGDRISIRQFTRPAAQTTVLTEGTPPSALNPTVGETVISVAQLGAYILGSDKLMAQGIDPQLTNWSEVFSELMRDSRDQYIRGLINTGTNVNYNGGGTARSSVASGGSLGWTDLRTARKTLKNSDVPPVVDGKYAAIIRPVVMSQLFADSTVINALQYAGPRSSDNPLFAGAVTELLGIRFFETSNASTFSGLGQSASFVEATLFVGKNGYAVTDADELTSQIIFHDIGSSGVTDPLNQVWSLGFKTAVGAAIVDSNRVLRVESWSTGS